MSESLPPAFVEKYKIGRVIGEGESTAGEPSMTAGSHRCSPCRHPSPAGNFSVVKECTRKADGVKFAVKCINKNALNPKDRSNLVQEISILKEVSARAADWTLVCVQLHSRVAFARIRSPLSSTTRTSSSSSTSSMKTP